MNVLKNVKKSDTGRVILKRRELETTIKKLLTEECINERTYSQDDLEKLIIKLAKCLNFASTSSVLYQEGIILRSDPFRDSIGLNPFILNNQLCSISSEYL